MPFCLFELNILDFGLHKGIEVDPEKVASILDIPPLKTSRTTIFSANLFGVSKIYSRFCEDFTSTKLSYKKVKWQWGVDQQNAFQTLKNSLTTPPVLKQADGTKPYIFRTDASNYALGAVLLQGDEHPIEYASRLLTPAERNYSTIEREALAVVWALKKFRGYIEGTEITVASDHQPLKWLLYLKSPTGRLARWALEIQSFNLKVQYIPGVLYRYVPDADSAEAQLVIPTAECELIMERHHNDPMAGHYGEEEHSENRQAILLDRHEKVHIRLY
ncbi:retrovirus-related Pol polyprotein from transposon 17.6 [Trichonephila clavipes]|nr:retrovirus-related Pol polyprotein from transposon 17.6 [Trichonephila clavipes]